MYHRILNSILSFGKAVALRLNRIHEWQPFTGRGVLALLLAGVGLWIFAIPESDLAAFLLSTVLLGTTGVALFVNLYLRIALPRRLRITAHFDSRELYSRREVPASLLLTGSSLPPLFSLRIRRLFREEGTQSPDHVVRGSEITSKRELFDTVLFPHRGVWTLQGLELELRDSFGLTALAWRFPLVASVEISASKIPIQPLPIVAGSTRIGDLMSFSRERLGDPFDLKPYDPSDGITRILWKTYARTGELVVRRREPAVLPEGEVAIYLIAERNDDYVVGALLSYLEQLQSSRVVVLFGTDGDADTTVLDPRSEQRTGKTSLGEVRDQNTQLTHGSFHSDPEEILHVMNRSVWSSLAGSGKEFALFLEALSLQGKGIQQVVVFAPQENKESWLGRITEAASAASIRPTVVFVPRNLDPISSFSAFSAFSGTLKRQGLRKNQTRARFRESTGLSSLFRFRPSAVSEREEAAKLSSAVVRAGGEPLICERLL